VRYEDKTQNGYRHFAKGKVAKEGIDALDAEELARVKPKIRANMCSCCDAIWAEENLKPVKMGENYLLFCHDCLKEYKKCS